MTVREMIKQLQQEGHVIEYYERKDGGVLVKSIDGVKYSGATGNKVVKWMTGNVISEKRAQQLHKITYTGKRAKKKKLPEGKVKKKLHRVQKRWNKAFPHKRGETPSVGLKTAQKTQWNLEHKGEEETLRLLDEAEKYAEGIAYSKNVDALIDYIDMWNMYENNPDLERIKKWLEENKDQVKEEWIAKAYEILYGLNEGVDVEVVCQQLEALFEMY